MNNLTWLLVVVLVSFSQLLPAQESLIATTSLKSVQNPYKIATGDKIRDFLGLLKDAKINNFYPESAFECQTWYDDKNKSYWILIVSTHWLLKVAAETFQAKESRNLIQYYEGSWDLKRDIGEENAGCSRFCLDSVEARAIVYNCIVHGKLIAVPKKQNSKP